MNRIFKKVKKMSPHTNKSVKNKVVSRISPFAPRNYTNPVDKILEYKIPQNPTEYDVVPNLKDYQINLIIRTVEQITKSPRPGTPSLDGPPSSEKETLVFRKIKSILNSPPARESDIVVQLLEEAEELPPAVKQYLVPIEFDETFGTEEKEEDTSDLEGGKKHKKKHKKKGKKTIYGTKKKHKKKHKKTHKKKKSKKKSKTLTLSLDNLFSDNPYFKKIRKKTHRRSKMRYNRKTHKRKKQSKRTHRR